MKRPGFNVLVIISITCFCIVVVLSSCGIQTGNPPLSEKPVWEEPEWRTAGNEMLDLAWKLTPGLTAEFRETQRAGISSGENTTERRHSITLQYSVETVSKSGPGRVTVTGRDLEATGSGSEALQFMVRSSDWLGVFELEPSGLMKNVKGFVSVRSLPTFPSHPVSIGSQWTGSVDLGFMPNLPQVVASGICTYRLMGLTNAHGHTWAKISFGGSVEIAGEECAIRRIIGVTTRDKEDSIVDEIMEDMPAERAGVLPGDIIVSFNGMTVRKWSDLFFAVAVSPPGEPAVMVVERNNEKRILAIIPDVAVTARVNAAGNVSGTLVFDVTQGTLVRLSIDPLTVDYSVQVGDERADHTVRIIQLIQQAAYRTD
jgi:hypothetical protein